MRTNDLIAALAADAPPPPLRLSRMAVLIAGSVVFACGLFLCVLGPREHLGAYWLQPEVAPKTLLPLLTAMVALPLALRMARPTGQPGLWAALLLIPLGGAGILWGLSYGGQPPQLRFASMTAAAVAECLGFILLLSLPPVLAGFRLLRRGASTRPALSGALLGLGCAAGAAAGYSLFCTQDAPLFYVTWYGLAILMVTALSALVGARRLRW